MTNSNINSFTVVTSAVGTEKIYAPKSPYGSGDDQTMTLTTINSYLNHDYFAGFDVNEHRAMATSTSTIVVWSGFQINSLLGTKANTSDLSTYATSASVDSLTNMHSTWINSVYSTKLNSVALSTYATSSALDTHKSNTSIHANHADILLGVNIGLSGGGDITSTRTISLDFNGLTAITTTAPDTDFLVGYLSSGEKKIKPREMWGIMETTQISTTTYSLQSTDYGKHLEFTGTAVQTVTIPNDADLNWPVDGSFMYTCINTNGLTFTGGTSSTVNNVSGYTTCNSLYGVGGSRKRASQTWVLWGNLDA